MKKIIFFLTLLCLKSTLHAQYIYTIKADSVKITNSCDTAELIIENHTQTVPGFLFNKGRGRTEFRRISQFNDTTVIIGGDTIHLGRGYKNFANADLILTDDRTHDGAFHDLTLQNFNGIDMLTGTPDGSGSHTMTLRNGFKAFNRINNVDGEGYSLSSQFNLNENNFNLRFSKNDDEVGGFLFNNPNFNIYASNGDYNHISSVSSTISDNEGTLDLHLTNIGGHVYLENFNVDNNHSVLFKTYMGDSISITQDNADGTGTSYVQKNDKFIFRSVGANDFRLIGLPSSSNSTDSMLVIDDNGQVKKKPQMSTRKSATVTASTYTVPADVDVVFVNYTGGTATISLPTGTLDREITIKNLNATNSVALSGLDPSESNTIATRGAITVKYTGSAWVGISKY